MKKKINSALLLCVTWLGLWGCSSYDSTSTVQVFTYLPPRITELSVLKAGVRMTIATEMYYPNHEDFSFFILLYGPSNTDFQAAIDNINMGSLTTVDQIPNYLASTEKPSVSGSYLNPITVTVSSSNFQALNTYKFAVIAYGYNESYGRLYENNGWLYSKISTSYLLHVPIFADLTVSIPGSLVADGNSWNVSNNNQATNGVDFTVKLENNAQDFDVMVPKGYVGVNPLGDVSEGAETLPQEGYIKGGGLNDYFPTVVGHSYAIKNTSLNTYGKILITSINEQDQKINFQLVYTTQAGQRNF